jgi:hypothetical protein
MVTKVILRQGHANPYKVVLRDPTVGSGGNKTLTALPSNLTLSGSLAGVLRSRNLVAQEVQLTYTGSTANLRVDRKLIAAPGSMVLLGQDAVTKKHYLVSAAPSGLSLTGAAANFGITGATPRVGRVTWTEFEAPAASYARVGKVTWVEFETPAASTARQGRLTWVELETPSAGVGIQVRIFRRIAKARSLGRIARLNYTLVNLGGGLYNVTTSSGISSDLVNSISYEGYEFP